MHVLSTCWHVQLLSFATNLGPTQLTAIASQGSQGGEAQTTNDKVEPMLCSANKLGRPSAVDAGPNVHVQLQNGKAVPAVRELLRSHVVKKPKRWENAISLRFGLRLSHPTSGSSDIPAEAQYPHDKNRSVLCFQDATSAVWCQFRYPVAAWSHLWFPW